MAKHIHFFLVVLLSALALCTLPMAIGTAFAQAPQAIPYQAIARNNAGNALINQPISIRMSIRNLTSTGTILYQETHAITTNSLGLFTLNIGQGTVVSGTFATINWGTGNKFIQTEMDPTGGTTYTNMGTEQFRSVPYALFAANGGTAGAGYTATSTSSVLIGLGSKTFTTQIGLAYLPNMRVRIANSASNYMEGVVTSYSSTSLIVNVDRIVGSGTFATWNIGIAGDVGAQGIQGLTGATGAQGPAGATGATGSQGIQGIQGLTGATGATGPGGSSGANGAGYTATSASSVLIGTGSKTFTTQAGLAYLPNMRVRIANSATNYMEGIVTSYIASTIVVNVDRAFGSGILSSWNFGIAGDVGAQGVAGATGPQGIQGIQGVAGLAGATGTAGAGYTATSTSSVLIGLGSKTITTQSGLAYLPNMRVRIANSGSNYMEGVVTSYATTSLVVNVDRIVGLGTFASWNIGIAGDVGAQGVAGATGLLQNGTAAGNTPYWNGSMWVVNSSNIFNNGGNVGIGTTIPTARLQVVDSSVVFNASGFASIAPNNPPVSGQGRRTMWYADKAAFRTGCAINNSWDKDSIGDYSFASGFATKAKGHISTAMGSGNTASGVVSTAMGNFTTASGDVSTAMGYTTTASGHYSTAMGNETKARAAVSVTMGTQTIAKNNNLLAIGQFNDTTSNNSIFEIGIGTSNTSRQNAMTVLLSNGNVGIGTTTPNSKLHVTGDILSTGTFGAGEDVTTTGAGTRMFFNPKKAAFRAGYVDGNHWDNDSIGGRSFATGYNSKAIGWDASAMGVGTRAVGFASLATGVSTTTGGQASTTMGTGTIANGYSSLAIGLFNEMLVAPEPFAQATTPLFIIGNGTGINNRSNVMVARNDGTVGIGTNTPPSKLTVQGDGTSPAIPGTTSNGLFRVANGISEGIDMGKMSVGPYLGWMQSGYAGNSADPMVINPLGGNVGIGTGTSSPAASLDVNGSIKLGSNGTVLAAVMKAAFPTGASTNITANTTVAITAIMANTQVGASVMVSPTGTLPAGLVIAYARISVAGTVEINIRNTTGASITLPAGVTFNITVIQ